MNKKQGFSPKYAAVLLVLAVAASALTIVLSHSSSEKALEAAVETPIVENLAGSTQPSPTLPATTPATTAPTSAASPTVTSSAARLPQPTAAVDTGAQHTAADRKPETAMPVRGDAIGLYAMECLSYNETTRDWRTHNGLDLAAEAGEPVGAAAAGTVYTAYEDDALGYTVVLRHSGGYTTRYSSLQEELCVQPGDEVTLGQTIGYAGDTALVETAMGSHVHFSVSCQDQPVDPAEFLNMT